VTRLIALFLVLICTASCGFAENLKFDSAMRSIATEYTAIHKAFCGDVTTGVDEAAKKIEELARAVDSSTIELENAPRLKDLPSRLAGSASKLVLAKDLAGKRTVFKELSSSMVEWALAEKPEGIHVASCSMAKARWLQREDKVFNPYYGASMLHCGKIEDKRSQSDGEPKDPAGSGSDHSGSGSER
jgi:Cu(I)/Ag(I) efflux system membrane fusion protein